MFKKCQEVHTKPAGSNKFLIWWYTIEILLQYHIIICQIFYCELWLITAFDDYCDLSDMNSQHEVSVNTILYVLV